MSSVDTPMRIDPNSAVPEQQRLADLERPSAVGVDRADAARRARARAARSDRRTAAAAGRRAPRRCARSRRRRRRRSRRRSTLLEYALDSRIERRPASARSAATGSLPPRRHDLARALVDGVGEQVAARLALLEADARERRQVEAAQHDDREADDRGDAGDLLRLDAQPHADQSDALLLLDLQAGCSLLCSVFRLMPSISAARVLLPLVCCSVSRISCRSASSTVVPGVEARGRARRACAAVDERRQVLDLDEPALGHDRRALDDVAQLADVAGPRVPLEDRASRARRRPPPTGCCAR